jgi:hypothetical protein
LLEKAILKSQKGFKSIALSFLRKIKLVYSLLCLLLEKDFLKG